jgi:hypothetical protein
VYAAWQTDEIIGQELLRNVGLGMMCVMVVTMMLLVSLQLSTYVFVCVIATLIDLVGFLHFWGMTIGKQQDSDPEIPWAKIIKERYMTCRLFSFMMKGDSWSHYLKGGADTLTHTQLLYTPHGVINSTDTIAGNCNFFIGLISLLSCAYFYCRLYRGGGGGDDLQKHL